MAICSFLFSSFLYKINCFHASKCFVQAKYLQKKINNIYILKYKITGVWVRVMMFNITLNIPIMSFLLVEEIGVPEENH